MADAGLGPGARLFVGRGRAAPVRRLRQAPARGRSRRVTTRSGSASTRASSRRHDRASAAISASCCGAGAARPDARASAVRPVRAGAAAARVPRGRPTEQRVIGRGSGHLVGADASARGGPHATGRTCSSRPPTRRRSRSALRWRSRSTTSRSSRIRSGSARAKGWRRRLMTRAAAARRVGRSSPTRSSRGASWRRSLGVAARSRFT